MSEELPREEGLPSEEGLPREEGLPERTEPYCDECGWASSCVYLFGFAVVQFVVLADVASGCVLSLLMVAACLMVCVPRDAFTSAQEEDRCLMRAALVIYVLGLLVAVVASVLLAMKTHRVTSLTPDPTCEPWAGSCQEGGQRSDGRTECDDCSDEISTCVDLSADGYWWSERGARYFPATEKYGKYWGWGRTRRLNGCGIPRGPSEGGTNGSFGAKGDEDQKRRWEEAKETGDCRPLFTSQTKCERYWRRWQDAWSAEGRGALVPSLVCWLLVLLGNCLCLLKNGRGTRRSPGGAQGSRARRRGLTGRPPPPQRAAEPETEPEAEAEEPGFVGKLAWYLFGGEEPAVGSEGVAVARPTPS